MINKDYSKNKLFDELGLLRLKDSYMMDGEQDPQDRFEFICNMFGSNPEHSQRLYNYASNHWLSYSTPILSFGRTKNGLPISCYLNYLEDSSEGLVNTLSETNWLSMLGGGVGIHIGIRGVDDKSTGVMPHLKLYEASSLAFRQGKCYAPGTEILTDRGWVLIEGLSTSDTVACVNDKGHLQWDKPTELVAEDYSGTMIRFYNENRGIDFSVTEDHSMVIQRKSKINGWGESLIKIIAAGVPRHNEARFLLSTVNPNKEKVDITPYEQLLIAFQADGYKTKNGDTEFHFSKERKIARLKSILDSTSFRYNIRSVIDGTTTITVYDFFGDKDFSWIDLKIISPNKALTMLEEIAEWDGCRSREYSITYSNTNLAAANKVHALAVIAGRSSRLNHLEREGNRKILHTVYISNNPYFNLEKLEKIKYEYTGKVYCCVVPTGKIIVRNNGVSLICGNTRRGSYAAYLDISHPDIVQFLEMRKPTGDPNLRTLNLNHGINIPDKFMQIIENCMNNPNYDDSWELIQPNNGKVVEVVSAKELWQKILEIRANTGEPYLWFIDTANKAIPEFQKKLGLKNHGSNLCSEISLVTSPERTAVCCLSSVNLEYYDHWKSNSQFIPDVLEMLDNVIEYFINHAPDAISRARYSAYRERSVGVGVLGFHAYLQKRRVPFESALAKSINLQIFKSIRSQLDLANENLAKSRLPCPDAAEFGIIKRNSHVMAIAPTASASIIMGNTSPSIEPYAANVYRQDTVSGAYINKNRQFKEFLENYAITNELDSDWIADQWESIIANKGSVQHLEWLDDYSKQVFKTAREIDPEWIISHACDRQEYIDQAQSVNIYIDPKIHVKRLHMLHFMAWKHGLKGLYYCRSEKVGSIDKMSSKIERIKIEDETYSKPIQQQNNIVNYWESSDSSICLACE